MSDSSERRLPAGAVDCHFHVFGAVDRFPYEASGYAPPAVDESDYARVRDRLGFSRGVVVETGVQARSHARLRAALTGLGDGYVGVTIGLPPPGAADSYAALTAAGVRALRLGTPGAPPVDALEDVASDLRDAGWHVELYMPGDSIADFVGRVGRVTDLGVDVVFDHLGRVDTARSSRQRGFAALLELLSSDRVWVKLSGADRLSASGPPYDDVASFAETLIDKGPHQVVWGSDWPHIGSPRPVRTAILFDALRRWTPDAEGLRRILVDNPTRLYRLAPAGVASGRNGH